MDPFHLTLTPQQAAYLQNYLPTSYSFQSAKLQSKRQRTLKKIDESFSSEFTPIVSKKKLTSSKNNQIKSVSQKVKENDQVQNQQAEAKRQHQIKTCDKEVIKQTDSSKNKTEGNLKTLIQKILRVLKNCKYSQSFHLAVDLVVQKVSDYSEAITQSIDLKTVQSRFKAGEYSSFEEFDADIRKIIAKSYRSKETDSKQYAVKQFQKIYKNAVQSHIKRVEDKASSTNKLIVQDQNIENQQLMSYSVQKQQLMSYSVQKQQLMSYSVQKQQLMSYSVQKHESKVKTKERKAENKNGQMLLDSSKQKIQRSESSLALTAQNSAMNELNFRERERLFNKIDKLSQQNLHTFIKLCGVKTSDEWSQIQIDLADLSEEIFRKIEVFLYQH